MNNIEKVPVEFLEGIGAYLVALRTWMELHDQAVSVLAERVEVLERLLAVNGITLPEPRGG